jgi:hypothetical protein
MQRKYWGGFVSGHLDWNHVDSGFGGFGTGNYVPVPAIFLKRKDARAQYADVREVKIVPMPKPKK